MAAAVKTAAIPAKASGTDLFMMKGSTVNLNAGGRGSSPLTGRLPTTARQALANHPFPTARAHPSTSTAAWSIFNGANTYSGRTNLNGGRAASLGRRRVVHQQQPQLQWRRFFKPAARLTAIPGQPPIRCNGPAPVVLPPWTIPCMCSSTAAARSPGAANSFVPDGSSLIFGSSTATDDVTFANKINLAGGNRSILVAANDDNTDRAILTGVISNGALTVGGRHARRDTGADGGQHLCRRNHDRQRHAGAEKHSQPQRQRRNGPLPALACFDISQTGDQAIGNLSGDGTANLGDNTLTINQAGNTAFFRRNQRRRHRRRHRRFSDQNRGRKPSPSAAPTRTPAQRKIAAGTLNLTGSLDSRNVHIAAGATLDDVNGRPAQRLDPVQRRNRQPERRRRSGRIRKHRHAQRQFPAP